MQSWMEITIYLARRKLSSAWCLKNQIFKSKKQNFLTSTASESLTISFSFSLWIHDFFNHFVNQVCRSRKYIWHRPTFIRIWKKGSVEQYSPTPYLATLINCMVWVLYGLPMVHPHSTLVVTINGTGTLIELVYILLFLFYSNRWKRLRVAAVVLIELIFISALAALVLTLVHTHKQRSMVVGIVCMVFNVMMYASPLSVMVSFGRDWSLIFFVQTRWRKWLHGSCHVNRLSLVS